MLVCSIARKARHSYHNSHPVTIKRGILSLCDDGASDHMCPRVTFIWSAEHMKRPRTASTGKVGLRGVKVNFVIHSHHSTVFSSSCPGGDNITPQTLSRCLRRPSAAIRRRPMSLGHCISTLRRYWPSQTRSRVEKPDCERFGTAYMGHEGVVMLLQAHFPVFTSPLRLHHVSPSHVDHCPPHHRNTTSVFCRPRLKRVQGPEDYIYLHRQRQERPRRSSAVRRHPFVFGCRDPASPEQQCLRCTM